VRVPVLVNNPDTDGAVVEACAGLVDKDTSTQQIAKEEILEELGYDVPLKKVEFIKTLKSSVGTAGTNSHLFYAEVVESERVSDGGGLDGEDIEVIRVPINDIEKFMAKATTDAVTMFLTMYYINLIRDD
jgi:UDP-sugar diphosphatase